MKPGLASDAPGGASTLGHLLATNRTQMRPHALSAREPRVLLVTQGAAWAAGTGVYAHRIREALIAQGMTVRLVELSSSFSETDVASLRTSILEFDPQVVHVLHCRPRHLLRLGRLRTEKPLVLTLHNLPPQECKIAFGYPLGPLYLFARNARYAPAAAAVCAALRISPPDAVVCDSQPVRRRVARILPHRIHAFECRLGPSRGDHHAVMVAPMKPSACHIELPETPRQLITVGAFIFHKGIHRMIPIMANLKRDGLACRLDVLGSRRDPHYYDYVSGLVARHRVGDVVTLIPDAPDGEIHNALERADIYVQPSLEEGFCLTFLDAALSVPSIIGTDVGAIPEIAALRGNTATCVPRGSQIALEDSIRQHLKRPTQPPVSPEVRRKLSARYSWSAAGARLLHIYGRVMATWRSHL
jgi:glycosyltransferase involved in cell wall biosynthesis